MWTYYGTSEIETNLLLLVAECLCFSSTLIFYCKSSANMRKVWNVCPIQYWKLNLCTTTITTTISFKLQRISKNAWFYIEQILHSHNFGSNLGHVGQVYGQYCNDEKSFKWNSDKMFHNSRDQEICTTWISEDECQSWRMKFSAERNSGWILENELVCWFNSES